MLKRLLLALLLIVVPSGWAHAQSIRPGDYQMEWAILHNPVSSDQPDLETGTMSIRLQTTPGAAACPPTSAYVVADAPASAVMGGTTTWCIKSDGTFDSSAGTSLGRWLQYTDTVAIIQAEQGSKANDKVMAVARFQEVGTLAVFITQPHTGDTVSSTVWVVIWVEGTSGSSNVFTLSVNGTAVATQNAGSSRGPVTLAWNSKSVANGAHTLKAEVHDATGNSGNTSITVTVNNP